MTVPCIYPPTLLHEIVFQLYIFFLSYLCISVANFNRIIYVKSHVIYTEDFTSIHFNFTEKTWLSLYILF